MEWDVWSKSDFTSKENVQMNIISIDPVNFVIYNKIQ